MYLLLIAVGLYFMHLLIDSITSTKQDTIECTMHEWERTYSNSEDHSAYNYLQCKKCKLIFTDGGSGYV